MCHTQRRLYPLLSIPSIYCHLSLTLAFRYAYALQTLARNPKFSYSDSCSHSHSYSHSHCHSHSYDLKNVKSFYRKTLYIILHLKLLHVCRPPKISNILSFCFVCHRDLSILRGFDRKTVQPKFKIRQWHIVETKLCVPAYR